MSTTPTTPISSISSNIKTTLTEGADKLIQSYKNMDDTFVIYMTGVIIAIIISIVVIYYIYINNLKSVEETFMNFLYPSQNSYISSIDKTYDKRFGDYYINTAYNACSGGNYKNDWVSLDVLRSVIKQGVRGLDFAIYNENGMPKIATSTSESYYVKETYNSLAFEDVIKTIVDSAFGDLAPNKTDPIILHLRVKSNDKDIYNEMAKTFNNYSGRMLKNSGSFSDRGLNFGDRILNTLFGKIVIIVDGINKTYEDSAAFSEYVNLVSSTDFMYSYRFFDILNTYTPEQLTEHNKVKMTIVLPNINNNPDNPSAALARSYGCQMVAMRYQLPDGYLLENIKFFDEARHAFVLKADNLRGSQSKVVITQKESSVNSSEKEKNKNLENGLVYVSDTNPANSYKTRSVTNNLFSFKF